MEEIKPVNTDKKEFESRDETRSKALFGNFRLSEVQAKAQIKLFLILILLH